MKNKTDEAPPKQELIDVLIAISVVAKRLARKLEKQKHHQEEEVRKHE